MGLTTPHKIKAIVKKVLRHYEYQCNGYAIRHVSESCIYTIEHPVTDERYGFEHTLKEARKFAKSLPELYPTSIHIF